MLCYLAMWIRRCSRVSCPPSPSLPPSRGHRLTPILSTDFTEELRRHLENQIPLHRFGKPEEVADAVVFLVGNEYANNTVLNLDGGLSAT